MKAVSFELIQNRAYEIWQREGSPHGLDKEHWAQAERELLDAAPEREETKPRAAAPPQREEIRKMPSGVADSPRERPNVGRPI